MHKKTVRKEIRELAKLHNVKYRILDMKNVHGYVDLQRDIIYVHKQLKSYDLLSAFLHEIGHIVAKRQSKFVVYHSAKRVFTPKERIIFKQTMYRAELWVEDWAAKEFKQRYSGKKYSRGYKFNSNACKLFLRKYYEDV